MPIAPASLGRTVRCLGTLVAVWGLLLPVGGTSATAPPAGSAGVTAVSTLNSSSVQLIAPNPPQPVDLGALGAMEVPPESWQGVARRLAASLVDPNRRAVEEPLFLPGAQVWAFGRSIPNTPAVLRDQFDGWTILSVQAFEYPRSHVAADIAGDLLRRRQQDPASVPEMLSRVLTPRADQMVSAEQTLMRWISSSLAPKQGSEVAVLILWNSKESRAPVFERLAILLVKAGRLPDGRYRVEAIRWGTAQQAVIEGY